MYRMDKNGRNCYAQLMHDTYINVEKKLKIKTNSKGIAKSVIL